MSLLTQDKHLNYYTEIQTHFLQAFHHKCQQENIAKDYSLKPILSAWGYYADAIDFTHDNIVDFALCIERLQQASNILTTQGEESVFYAASLINKSINFLKEKNVKMMDTLHLQVLTKIIDDILKGKLRGVPIEIILSSTEELLKNSFLKGYYFSNPNGIYSEEIYSIGHLCEYCLQTLDDLKSFLSYNDNLQDNIVISYLYGVSTKKERAKLSEENVDSEYIHILVQKHKIIDLILEDIDLKISFMKKSISILEKTKPDYCADFRRFLDDTFNIYFQKCGLSNENKFSNKSHF